MTNKLVLEVEPRKFKRAVKMATRCISYFRHEHYGARKEAARYGFPWGIKAKQHYDEMEEVMCYLEDLAGIER